MELRRIEFGKAVRVDGMHETYLDSTKHKCKLVFDPKTQLVNVKTHKGAVIVIPLSNVSDMHPIIEKKLDESAKS